MLLRLLARPLFVRGRYALGPTISRGAFGTVCECTLAVNPSAAAASAPPLAVKLIETRRSRYRRSNLCEVFAEALALWSLRGEPQAAQLYDLGTDGSSYWMVMRRYACTLKQWADGAWSARNGWVEAAEAASPSPAAKASAAAAAVAAKVTPAATVTALADANAMERAMTSALASVVAADGNDGGDGQATPTADGGRPSLGRLLDAYGRVLNTVAMLHARGVHHFDLKAENFLCDAQPQGSEAQVAAAAAQTRRGVVADPPQLVVADFGVATVTRKGSDGRTPRDRGTECIKSPEMIAFAIGGGGGGAGGSAAVTKATGGCGAGRPGALRPWRRTAPRFSRRRRQLRATYGR